MSLIKREPGTTRVRESGASRLMEPFSSEGFLNDFFGPASRLFSGFDASVPRVNVLEEEKNYVVTVDIPGVPKENIELSIDEGILTIKAHTESEQKEEKEGRVIRLERHQGQYLRRLALGANVSAKGIDAALKDGVLKITIPKLEPGTPTRVKIDVH